MADDDWVEIVPAEGELKATARALLAVAGHPDLVRTVRAGNAFLVAPAVAALYHGDEPQKPTRGRKPRKTEE
jgi:hypothetical protein